MSFGSRSITMKLDEYHREGRQAAAERNKSELSLEMQQSRLGSFEILRSIIASRLTIWGLVIGGLLGLATRLPM
jgi:hypothetical protein